MYRGGLEGPMVRVSKRVSCLVVGSRLRPHPGCACYPHQKALGAEETTHRLAPRLRAGAHQKSVATILQNGRSPVDVLHIELYPRLGGR